MSTKFDKLINKKIGEAEISPSTSLWDKIETELDEKENKKVILIPFWQQSLFKQVVAASVIFLLGGITASILFNNNTLNTTTEIAENEKLNNDRVTDVKSNTKGVVNNIVNLDTSEEQKIANNQKENSSFINSASTKSSTKNIKITNTGNTAQPKSQTTNRFANINNNSKKSVNQNSLNVQSSNGQNLSASNYNWIYDEQTGAYQVVLKQDNKLLNNSFLINNSVNKKQGSSLIASGNGINENATEGKTSMMSLIEKQEDEKIETVALNEEEDSYKQFKTKVTKLNYKGFWLGPNVGYESLFAGGEHYPGGSFGINLGYDFGGSFGLQTGIKYAINAKMIKVNNLDGNLIDFRSEMNSVHVPFFLRYKFTKLTQKYSKPLSLNLLAGLDYSFMDRKGLHQLGFVAGVEYDIFTQADLMLTLGVRGGAYNNLNRNNTEILEKLTPFNYILSAYIAVRFIDWAKKK